MWREHVEEGMWKEIVERMRVKGFED